MKVITTIPPYAPFIADIAGHPIISGVRLNTVMPLKGSIEEMLKRLQSILGNKEIWIDLKCRQIRTSHGGSKFFNSPQSIRTYEIRGKTVVLDPSDPRTHGVLRTPPWAELEITHKISLDLSKGPVKCYFQDGYDSAYLVEIIDGNRLIMLDGPKRVVGGGESINILDPTLAIEGYFTETDHAYIEAAKKVGIHTFMLSYVEQDSDIADMRTLDPDAKILAKIESEKGIEWAATRLGQCGPNVSLMAARGDLYVEVGPAANRILPALRKIIKADPNAVLASRILTSLRNNSRPQCSDITDIECMRLMGYNTIMVGDDICFDKDTLLLSLDILNAIG
ncbi:MAG: pyruvate kinase [Patescibacteria group bacterium]